MMFWRTLRRLSKKPAVLVFSLAAAFSSAAQESGGAPSGAGAPAHGGGSVEAQANNPLANMIAFNLQNYYIGDLTVIDKDANQFWLRYAQPLSIGESKWIMRASLPINSFPTGQRLKTHNGIGDLNVFAAYLIDTGNPAVSFGIGPQVTAPTAAQDGLGSDKWSAGFANVLFNASSPKLQYGYLLTWQHSFAGADGLQPFCGAAVVGGGRGPGPAGVAGIYGLQYAISGIKDSQREGT